jgi:hypothetical protein
VKQVVRCCENVPFKPLGHRLIASHSPRLEGTDAKHMASSPHPYHISVASSSRDLLPAINRLLPQVTVTLGSSHLALHVTLGSSRDAHITSFAIHTRLIVQQLTDKAPVLLQEQLDRILDAPGTILFVARDTSSSSSSNDGGDIIGMLTLCIFSTPTGTRATIGKRPPPLPPSPPPLLPPDPLPPQSWC